ncbi:DUF7351 domain-containing protein [Halocatena marina]|uniref:DUF7351 domain-containing protein n=1 Tax=Halocatena marina TaxID=2934937 RepID=UPI00200E1211|nr:hypothetical protein [Halocatena marina]
MGRPGRNSDENGPSGAVNHGDSFGQLANTTRLEIVQVLATEDTTIGYTELFEQVSIGDRGQFNYHLRLLVDGYVQKSEDGYRLAQSGVRAANVLASNSLENGANCQFEQVDSQCGTCGCEAVEIGYRAGEGIVRCPDCERHLTRFDFPPAAVDTYTLQEFVDAFSRRTRAYFRQADDGICPFCAHSLSTEIQPSAATQADEIPVVGNCSECPAGIRAPVGLLLSNRPRIQSLFADSEVAFRETPFWEFEWCTFAAPTIQQTDPLVASLTIEVADTSVSVLVNSRVEILEIQY